MSEHKKLFKKKASNNERMRHKRHGNKSPSQVADKQVPQPDTIFLEQALEHPEHARPEDILSVQRQLGNQAVRRVLSMPGSDEKLVGEKGGRLTEPMAQEIRQASRSGQPLPKTLRSEMSDRIGQELGDVQLHNDRQADSLSRRLSATSFTVGKHIFFRRGEYSPDTDRGRYILAHELAHTIQQSGAASLGSPLTLGPADDHYEQQAHSVARGSGGGAIRSGAALQASRVQRTKLNFKDLLQMWQLRSEKPVTGGAIPSKEPFQQPRPTPNISTPDVSTGLAPSQSLSMNPTPSLPRPTFPERKLPPLPPRKPIQKPGGPVIENPIANKGNLETPVIKPKSNSGGDIKIENKPRIVPQRKRAGGFRPFDPTKEDDDEKKLDDVNLSGKMVGMSQFKGDWKTALGTTAFSLGTIGGGIGMVGKGLGVAKEYEKNEKTKGRLGTSGALIGGLASGISLVSSGLSGIKSMGDLSGAFSKKYRGSKTGKQIARQKGIRAGVDLTSTALGAGKASSGLAKSIASLTKDDQSKTGAGYAGGIFGILGGLLGGGKSLYDMYGSVTSGAKGMKFQSSKDENIRKIAKVHGQQRASKFAESGLGLVKGLSGIAGGIGGILSSAGVGGTSILGSVTSGIGLLSGIGQKVAKGAGSKDVGTAAKGLAVRIKAGQSDALKYAKSLGIDPQNAFDTKPEEWGDSEIDLLTELIKMKMSG